MCVCVCVCVCACVRACVRACVCACVDACRKHTVEYLDEWIERTKMNGGVVPSNIGLDGTIGGECDGKWWGGVYGWGFSCIDIHNLPTDTPALELEKQGKATRVWRGLGQSYGFVCPGGFANGLLLTGDQKYDRALMAHTSLSSEQSRLLSLLSLLCTQVCGCMAELP